MSQQIADTIAALTTTAHCVVCECGSCVRRRRGLPVFADDDVWNTKLAQDIAARSVRDDLTALSP